MTRRSYVLAAVAITLLPWSLRAAETKKADAKTPPGGAVAKADPGYAATAAGQAADNEVWYSPGISEFAGRFGWWALDSQGSPVQTGEFQDLDSSAFWDVDGLWSNGDRTIDFTVTGTDNEGTLGRLYYFGPRVTVKADYDRYIRRLPFRGVAIEDPQRAGQFIFENFNPNIPASPPAPANQQVLNSDVLKPGQDYAFRVQEFKANFQGPLAENLKWRINVWGIDREGVRQATKMGHCFNESNLTQGQPTGNRCHVLAQPQRIDWATTEVVPALEAKIGPVVAEYSRTMRTFDPNDQTVTRLYTNVHDGWPLASSPGDLNPIPYDIQAPNFTQIDRLKLSSDLDEFNHLYALMYIGDTHNENRGVNRFFNGYDLRWTNDAVDGFKWTAYSKKFREDGQLPSTFPEAPLINGGDTIADYQHPLNYDKVSAGLKGNWRPAVSGWPAAEGLGVTWGYEYSRLNRQYADYEARDPRWVFVAGPTSEQDVFDRWTFFQPDTVLNTLNVGTSMRWSSTFDSFVRYKYIDASNPIYGFRATNGDTNTNQPEQSNLIEIGGTWMPATNFMLSATVGLEARNHDSLHTNFFQAFNVFHNNPRENGFDEYTYPIVLSAWYAPTEKWSLNGGYASFNNSIEQLIALGDQYGDNLLNTTGATVPNPAFPGFGPPFIGPRDYFEPDVFQSLWRFASRSQVVNLGATYAWTQRVKLTGGYEYTWSRAGITSNPAPATAIDPADTVAPPTVVTLDPATAWQTIREVSDVVVRTNRITGGVDYLARERVTLFFRYNYFGYDDLGGTGYTGRVHGLLGGMSAMF